MSYVYLFVNAIVVALMAMYVYIYEKERGIGDISDEHDTSRSTEDIKATTAMFVVALMVLYVYVNERRMRTISSKVNHDRTEQNIIQINEELHQRETDIKKMKEELESTIKESSRNALEQMKVSTREKIDILRNEMVEKDNAHRKETVQFRALREELNEIKKAACATASTAFFAALNPHVTLTGFDAILKFDDVKVNRGGAYDPSTGVFTATVQGLYHFSCLLLANHGAVVHYQLNKNDQPYIYGYSHKGLAADSSTISAVIELTVGDRVFVKHRAAAAEVVYGVAHTSFSGYFIHK